MIGRRGFIFGLGATLAVIRTPGLIMPVKRLVTLTSADVVWTASSGEGLGSATYYVTFIERLVEKTIDGYGGIEGRFHTDPPSAA